MTASWMFLSHHGHVLLYIARNSDARLREVSAAVGITERAVQAIVNNLVAEGYVSRTRLGRRNHYDIHPETPLRHPLERHLDTGRLIRALGPDEGR